MKKFNFIGNFAMMIPTALSMATPYAIASFGLILGMSNSAFSQDYQISINEKIRESFSLSQQAYLISQRQTSEKRVALVIGNSNYQHGSKLRNAVNDANDVAKSLRDLNFEVILLTNGNLKSMDQSLERFYRELEKGAVGLFYYAGHGIQVNGENYLIPVDARLDRESEVNYETLPLGKLLAAMEETDNNVNIVILDACRDNPFGRSWTRSSNNKGLAAIQNSATGTFIAYATGPGNVAQDGTGRNGTFTEALLKNLKNPNQNVEEIFKQVRIDVANKTDNAQVPWTTSSLIGDFFFSGSQEKPSSNNNQNITRKEENITPPVVEEKKPQPPYNDSVAINNRSNSPFQDLTGANLTPRKISLLRSFIAGYNFKEAPCGSDRHQVTITLSNRYVMCAEGNSKHPSGNFSLEIPSLD
ncbi:caspase family protein [Cyanobacterium aponinum]|uniref:caspase family protein n=1 Tax=Cyanobacterium aponinum TaxID=379064 RepID=UPI000C12CBA8|nr:caspase domain-containing protein [Cyanobacterium aponinum]PHV62585.1 peptidase C14 [Cyanobacterium aponinum IPPAS B-1201]